MTRRRRKTNASGSHTLSTTSFPCMHALNVTRHRLTMAHTDIHGQHSHMYRDADTQTRACTHTELYTRTHRLTRDASLPCPRRARIPITRSLALTLALPLLLLLLLLLGHCRIPHCVVILIAPVGRVWVGCSCIGGGGSGALTMGCAPASLLLVRGRLVVGVLLTTVGWLGVAVTVGAVGIVAGGRAAAAVLLTERGERLVRGRRQGSTWRYVPRLRLYPQWRVWRLRWRHESRRGQSRGRVLRGRTAGRH